MLPGAPGVPCALPPPPAREPAFAPSLCAVWHQPPLANLWRSTLWPPLASPSSGLPARKSQLAGRSHRMFLRKIQTTGRAQRARQLERHAAVGACRVATCSGCDGQPLAFARARRSERSALSLALPLPPAPRVQSRARRRMGPAEVVAARGFCPAPAAESPGRAQLPATPAWSGSRTLGCLREMAPAVQISRRDRRCRGPRNTRQFGPPVGRRTHQSS
eukprot:SAG31_NODE_3509_length_4182_cov_2.493020_2_plen_218_part_00